MVIFNNISPQSKLHLLKMSDSSRPPSYSSFDVDPYSGRPLHPNLVQGQSFSSSSQAPATAYHGHPNQAPMTANHGYPPMGVHSHPSHPPFAQQAGQISANHGSYSVVAAYNSDGFFKLVKSEFATLDWRPQQENIGVEIKWPVLPKEYRRGTLVKILYPVGTRKLGGHSHEVSQKSLLRVVSGFSHYFFLSSKRRTRTQLSSWTVDMPCILSTTRRKLNAPSQTQMDSPIPSRVPISRRSGATTDPTTSFVKSVCCILVNYFIL